jgi:hypothetical protein
MVQITGLDQLARRLDDLQKAIAALDGQLGTVKFNPHDPASIEAAIQQVTATIDERLGSYASDPMVDSIASKAKEHFRTKIIERAAVARLRSDEQS